MAIITGTGMEIITLYRSYNVLISFFMPVRIADDLSALCRGYWLLS